MIRVALHSLFIVLIAANVSVLAELPALAETGQAEIAFWNTIKDTKEASEFEAYLDAYPNGQFAALAKLRLKKLKTGTSPATSRNRDKPMSGVEFVEQRANAGNLEAMNTLADSVANSAMTSIDQRRRVLISSTATGPWCHPCLTILN